MKTATMARTGLKTARPDNRLFFRNPLYEVPVLVRNVNTGERFQGSVMDLSGSGLGMQTPQMYREGTIFEISMDIPDGFEPLRLLGKVRWSRQSELGRIRTGVMILNPRFMSLTRILKLVC